MVRLRRPARRARLPNPDLRLPRILPRRRRGLFRWDKDISAIWQDVGGAVGFLRTEGVRRIGLVGASMGGTASLVYASESGVDIDAVVTLSAPDAIEGLTAGPDVLQTVSAAKLFLAGNGDGNAAATAQAFYNESAQPKRVEILTTADHGTDILEGNQAEIAQNLIVGWLAQHVPVDMSRPIVFLTDYGMADEFVGVCHGVMLRIAPDVRVIDLTHSIPRQDVMHGALTLGRATSYLPEDAVYVAVVDPGVGSGRGSIAVRAASGALLVGPDNGVLSLAWEALGGAEDAVEITSDDVVLQPVSRTFHGRDVFAPAAAHLAVGMPLAALGSALDVDRLHVLELPGPMVAVGSDRRPRDRRRRVRQRAVERRAGRPRGGRHRTDADGPRPKRSPRRHLRGRSPRSDGGDHRLAATAGAGRQPGERRRDARPVGRQDRRPRVAAGRPVRARR